MKTRFSIIFLVVVAVILYGLTLRGVWGNPEVATVKAQYEGATNPLELSPERGRFAHVMSLVERGSYDLGPELGMLAYPDVGYIGNRFYSFFAPGISYMAAPLYALGSRYEMAQVFTFALVPILSIGAMIYLFRIAREIVGLPVWASLFASLVFGFSSTAWSYAITLYQHHVTVFFVLSGFYAAWRYSKKTQYSWVWGAWVWVAYALAFTVDYPNVVLMAPVIGYFFLRSFEIRAWESGTIISLRNSFIVTSIAFMVLTGAHLYHNSIHYGGVLNLSGELASYRSIVEAAETDEPETEEEKTAIGFFDEYHLAHSFQTLTFSLDRGLFFYGPIFLLGVWGMIRSLRNTPSLEGGTLAAIVLINVFLYSSWGDPWGGWAYGTRYLILSISVLALFVAYWATTYRSYAARWLLMILLSYSVWVALLGALTTNAIPPDVEAIGLGVSPNYMLNLEYLEKGQSGSFVYRTFVAEHLSLIDYFWAIYGLVMLVCIAVVFGFRRLFHEH